MYYDLLFSLGLNYVWISQDASSVSFDFVKQRIIDQFVQQWSISVYDCEKLCIYRNIRYNFVMRNILFFVVMCIYLQHYAVVH
jgi:hypothetical protein